MNVYMNLTFGTSEGRKYTLRVPRADESAGAAIVKGTMNTLITANVIKTIGGDLATRDSAKLFKVTSQDIDLD